MLGLDVRNRGAFGLLEMDFGSQQECSQTKVREGQNDVEILMHVPVVQQVMAVQAKENTGSLQVSFTG